MNTSEMAERARDVQEQARAWQEAAKYKAQRAGDIADQYIHENTWTSIAVAAGVGCIIGFLLARSGS